MRLTARGRQQVSRRLRTARGHTETRRLGGGEQQNGMAEGREREFPLWARSRQQESQIAELWICPTFEQCGTDAFCRTVEWSGG